MKPLDGLVPYVLASMHPLMHASMLFTSLLLVSFDNEEFYKVTKTFDKESDCTEAKEFASV
jgi:hypothetical protein